MCYLLNIPQQSKKGGCNERGFWFLECHPDILVNRAVRLRHLNLLATKVLMALERQTSLLPLCGLFVGIGLCADWFNWILESIDSSCTCGVWSELVSDDIRPLLNANIQRERRAQSSQRFLLCSAGCFPVSVALEFASCPQQLAFLF